MYLDFIYSKEQQVIYRVIVWRENCPFIFCFVRASWTSGSVTQGLEKSGGKKISELITPRPLILHSSHSDLSSNNDYILGHSEIVYSGPPQYISLFEINTDVGKWRVIKIQYVQFVCQMAQVTTNL